MSGTTVSLLVEAAASGAYPARRFNKRERKLAEMAKAGASHVCVAAANYTTLGGAAAEAITLAGLLTTDIVTCTLKATGATPVTITKVAATANTLTVTFSANPSTDHVITYHVLRALV
jgi:hypothetical protein